MFFKIVKQHDIRDCGAACLSMICRNYGLILPMATCRELIKVDNNGASIFGIVDGAGKIGLTATALEGCPEDLIAAVKKGDVCFPCIARVIMDGMYEHFVVIRKIKRNRIYIADPAKGKTVYKLPAFFSIWTGHVIVFKKSASFQKGNRQKGTLTQFIRLVTVQKNLLVAVFFVSLIISAISITGAFLFQFLLEGIEAGTADGFLGLPLWKMCLAVIGLYALQALLEWFRGVCLARLSTRVDLALMTRFFDHTLELPIRHIDGRKTGEVLSRFDDAANIRDTVSSAALSLVLDTFMVTVCVFILLSLNQYLFFVALGTVLAYAVTATAFIKPTKNINRTLMQKNEAITSYLKESIDGIETVKAFGREKNIEGKFKKLFQSFTRENIRANILYSALNSLSSLTASAGIVILLWCGTALVMCDRLSFGVLLTFYSLLGYFLTPVQRLFNLLPQMQTSVAAAERLHDILDLETEADSVETIENGDIDFDRVSFRYGNRDLVVKDVSFHIPCGSTAAFVGESGSGKTTLAKLLMGFYEPESGQIRVNGKPITTLTSKAMRNKIAYVSQEVFLFSDSVRNNLTFGDPSITDEQIKEACKKSHADTFINKLPLQYDTLIGENGHDLSGGQKQRLALARALLKEPKILILDEATSHLDTVTEESIRETIAQLDDKITCIIIAHRLNTVRRCDQIFVMKEGMITENGTHESLLTANGLYKHLFDQSI